MRKFDASKMLSMLKKYGLLLLGISLLTYSCKLREDLEKINPVPKDQAYRVAVPLIDSRLTMEDMFTVVRDQAGVDASEYLNIDDDGFITLIYQQAVEVPAFAGLDQIEIDDVTVDPIVMDMSQEMPAIPSMNIDAGSVTIREVINDDETADNIDLIGQVGSTVNDTVVQALSDVSQMETVDYGYFCVTETTTVTILGISQDTVITHCTDTMSDETLELLELDEVGLGDGRIPCMDDQEYECMEADTQVEVSMTLQEIIDNGLSTEEAIESEIGADIVGDSIYYPVNEDIPALESQTLEATDPIVEEIPLEGFSYVTLEDGFITMTIVNHFPFALTDVEFEVRTGTTDQDVLLGTLSFDRIPGLTTSKDSIAMAGQNLYDDLSFQMMGMTTEEYSGPIDVDSSMSLSLVVRDMAIESGTGTKQALIDNGLIESDTLAMDTMVNSFDLGADMTISQVTLASGSFNYSVTSSFATDMRIGIRIPDLVDSTGNEFETIIDLDYTAGSASTTDADSIDLTEYDLLIMDEGDTMGSVSVIYYAMLTSNEEISFTENIFFSFGASITDISVNEARGNFGSLELPAIDTSINFDLYNSQFSGKIIFSEPSLNVIFANSFGLPVGINFDMTGYNTQTGETAEIGNFTADNLIIAAPETPGDTIIDTFIVDESNGLDDLFGLPPNGMELSLGVVTNPVQVLDGDTLVPDNFIVSNSSISAAVEVSIPFVGRVENFQLQDTMDFSLNQDIDVEKSTLTLNLTIDNDFPVTVGMNITFLDANGEELGSLFDSEVADSIFAAATVDAEGNLLEATSRNKPIVLSGEKASMLAEASQLIITGKLSTPDAEANQDIKFYSSYGFTIKMGLLVSVNTDDLIPFLN